MCGGYDQMASSRRASPLPLPGPKSQATHAALNGGNVSLIESVSSPGAGVWDGEPLSADTGPRR